MIQSDYLVLEFRLVEAREAFEQTPCDLLYGALHFTYQRVIARFGVSMRYSKGYNEWAGVAECRGSPYDKERAVLTAAKIRDNHSGSAQDRRELARMESIVAGCSADDDDDWSPGKRGANIPIADNGLAKAALQRNQPIKLSKRVLDTLAKECFDRGKEAAEADWDADDLVDDPTPNSADPTMMSYAQMYPNDYGTLLRSWRDGYHEQAEQFRREVKYFEGVSFGL